MKTVIGINGNWSTDRPSPDLVVVRINYINAVAGAGGVPVVLPSIDDARLIRHQVEICDGFVFVGGPDIDPAKYGEVPHPLNGDIAGAREAYDFLLLQEVLASKKPFLAICLGCQELNVAFGGTLIQDIVCETDSKIPHSLKQAPYLHRHDVVIENGSQLQALLGGVASINTNSAHHQSIREVGDGLRVAARCTDGIIEAVEVENYGFGFGIQWHPEYLQTENSHKRLFEGLIEASIQAKRQVVVV